MEHLTFETCIKKGWISTWQAFVRLRWIFLGVCVVLTCTALLINQRPDPATSLDPTLRSTNAALWMLYTLINWIATSTLAIKVYRFILLGEGPTPLLPMHGKPLLRYLFASCGIVFLIVGLAIVFVIAGAKSALIYMVLGLCLFYLSIRTLLIFPAIAIGSPIAWRAAWQDSRQHFWSIVGINVLYGSPVLIVGFVVGVLAALGIRGIAGDTRSLVVSAGTAVVGAAWAVLTSALNAWLYRRHANRLLALAPDYPR